MLCIVIFSFKYDYKNQRQEKRFNSVRDRRALM